MNSRSPETPADEKTLEIALVTQGLTAPRITPEHVNAQIVSADYHRFPGTCLTVCVLTLRNGFTVTGESACASPENFDEQIGRDLAARNARDKIWSLEGYLLCERLHAATVNPVPAPQYEDFIARAAHEVNRAYCQAMGDWSQPTWEDAPEWQRDSAVNGVKFHLANPHATPENSHESWLAQKEAEGWRYGEVKDAEQKTHPCFRPYAELPVEQRAKDYLFRAVIHALK